ncbi:hypothetical protein PsalN5692_00814 [Piscirickettsia salmonis]|uniref:hypothetical protein n=1 Tax=Piscirickettsia salmonis TaxID=1238 RepID=UPI001E319457|nr:hypothetical protein [Piscirickettsia salmonis]QGP49376.1 hypothetical protein PsalN5692_00814 [Piscirickettsia salmonis]
MNNGNMVESGVEGEVQASEETDGGMTENGAEGGAQTSDEIDGYMTKNDVDEEVKDREKGVGKLEKKGFASSVDKHDTIQKAVAKVKRHKDITGAEEEARIRLKKTEKALGIPSTEQEEHQGSPLSGDMVDGPAPASQQLQQNACLFQQQQQQAEPAQNESNKSFFSCAIL